MLRASCLAVLLSIVAVAQDKQQDKKPEVHLNHAFITPDLETYEAIRTSDFVKQFAVWEERTTKRKDITYTGFYLYGQHTYFEFLKPDGPDSVGSANIMFGVDRTGDLELLQKRAEAAGVKTEIKTITRGFNGKDVDWFRALDRKDPQGPSIGMYTMEYVPTFLREWNPTPKEKAGVRREDVLRRYAEVVKQDVSDKIMADIKTVFARLPEPALGPSRNDCQALGFDVEGTPPAPTICKQDQTALFLWQEQTPGIACVAFQLRQKLPDSDHAIGKTRLMIRGNVAYWDFHPERYSWEAEQVAGLPPPCHHIR